MMEVFDPETEAPQFVEWLRETLDKLESDDVKLYSTPVWVEAWEQAQINAERFRKDFDPLPSKYSRFSWGPNDPETQELVDGLKERVRALLAVLPGGEIRPPRPKCVITEVEQFVTLLQMASMLNVSKRTLARMYRVGKLPEPDIVGATGKANQWRWSTVKPVLEQEYSRTLPDTYPSDRFVRSI